MILIDYSSISIRIVAAMSMQNGQMDLGLIRHTVLNNIRLIRQKFKNQYGEVVICCDGRNSWRKQISPQYKANRKKSKDDNKEYNKERKLYLKANNQCEAKLQGCKKVATQIHHKKGRVGKLLTDVRYWLPVCEDCHRRIEDNPKMAYEKGLSLKRTTV